MKNLISKEEKDCIDSICSHYSIKKYTINPDGSVDVHGDVNFHDKKLNKIPLRFGNVSGSFNCSLNLLTSFEGVPVTVGGTFDCYDNRLSSLDGSPTYVGGNLFCDYNHLTSTYSGDIDIEVVGDVDLSNNELPQLLQGSYKHIKLILKYQRHFFIWNDDLTLNEENFQNLIAEIEDGLE
jgi:hypothetical protein